MAIAFGRLRYGLDAYDEHCCLKPPVLLVLVLVFLCRSLLLPIVMYLAAMNQSAQQFGELIYGSEPAFSLIAAIPGLAVFYALRKRKPKANVTVHWIWTHGRLLLCCSVLIQAIPPARAVLSAFAQGPWGVAGSPDDLTPFLLGILDAWILIYLLSSRRVRDTFRDFPTAAHE